MAKITDLMVALKNEADRVAAEVAAGQTQLSALQSTHADLKAEVDKAADKALAAREDENNARARADGMVKAAIKRAAEIVGVADAAAAKTVADAENQAKVIVNDAESEADHTRSILAQDKMRLTADVMSLREEHSRLSAEMAQWQAQAKKIAG